MYIVRFGNDIDIVWKLYSRNGMKFSLEGQNIRVWLLAGPYKKEITSYSIQLRNELHFSIDADDLTRLGVYRIQLSILDENAETEDATIDVMDVFQIVSRVYPDNTGNNVLDGDVILTMSSTLSTIETSALEGASAYEIAVNHGFEGDEEAWLNSLSGKSAYEVAVDNGFEGTETEWLASLKGEKGDTGATGATGPKGDKGDAATVSVGTVTTGAAGSSATITNSGSTQDAVLNFTIPKGDQGEPAVGIENYVTVEATAQTAAATDVLPATGSADTLYRVANWDGTQYDDTTYSVYGWYDGAYILLEKKEVGIDDEPTSGSDNLVKSGGIYNSIDSLRGNTNVVFDFSTGSVAAYANRRCNYTFKAGHRYSIVVVTDDDTINTYFSTRNAQGNSLQTPLLTGKGARTGEFDCTADATYLYMSYSAAGPAIEYSVVIWDMTEMSIYANTFNIDKILTTLRGNRNAFFVGEGAVDVIIKPDNLIGGRTYALMYDDTNVTSIRITSTNGTEIKYLRNGSDNKCPVFVEVFEGFEDVSITFQAVNGATVYYTIEDITEVLCLYRDSKKPLFEMGVLYGFQYWSSISNNHSSNNTIRTKLGSCLRLNKGDVVQLTDYEDKAFQLLWGDTNSGWQQQAYEIPNDGLYCIKVRDSGGTTYDSYEYLASLVEIVPAEKVAIDDIDDSLSEIDNIVQYALAVSPANEKRDITFTNTGHFIRSDGTVGDSTNWRQSNVIRLYKGEVISINCYATSSNATIIATTDAEQSSYTPVVFGGATLTEHKYYALEDCYVILQYYRISGTPVIYNDSERLREIESSIEEIDIKVDALDAEINGSIPDYAVKEKDRVYRELLERQNSASVVLAFNTDQHFDIDYSSRNHSYNPRYVLQGIEMLAKIAESIPIDLVIFGGDAPGYGGGSSNTVSGIIETVSKLFVPLSDVNLPIVSIPGNHDAYQNNNDVTPYGMFNAHYKRFRCFNGISRGGHSGYDNCDYYIDDAEHEIRYIFVDVNSGYVGSARTESYTAFLTDALQTMPVTYDAVVFSHNPLTSEFSALKKYDSNGNESAAFGNPADVHTVLDTYANRIIACICGHSHADVYAYSSSGILYIETQCAAAHARYGYDNIPFARELNTFTDTAYDFFIINKEAQTIEAIRYGQGSNRKWSYGTNGSLISYTNCIYGTCSVNDVTIVFTDTNSNAISAIVDSDGNYEVYLELGKMYTISCVGYTISENSITVNSNTELNLTLTAEE